MDKNKIIMITYVSILLIVLGLGIYRAITYKPTKTDDYSVNRLDKLNTLMNSMLGPK